MRSLSATYCVSALSLHIEFTDSIIKLWNAFPIETVVNPSISTFKSSVKDLYFAPSLGCATFMLYYSLFFFFFFFFSFGFLNISFGYWNLSIVVNFFEVFARYKKEKSCKYIYALFFTFGSVTSVLVKSVCLVMYKLLSHLMTENDNHSTLEELVMDLLLVH